MQSHSLGIFAGFKIPVPFPDRLRMMRDAGFEATVLWWEEDDAEKRALRHRVPDMVRAAGLWVDHIHVPYRGCNALWSGCELERRAIVERHCGWVRDCARHGVPCMVMHVTQGRAVPVPVTEGIDSLRRIVAVAEAHGVTVAIENTHCPQHVTALLKGIDSPHLGLCYDISHDVLHSPVPFALLWRWRHRVAALHLNDTDGRLDRHWLPGEGVINYEALAGLIPPGPALMLEAVPKDRSEAAPSFLRRAFESSMCLGTYGVGGSKLREVRIRNLRPPASSLRPQI